MSRATCPMKALCVFFSFLTLAGATLLSAQGRDPKLDALADQLARSLGKTKFVKQQHHAPIAYLVFDFSGVGGRATQLGAHLADELSDALENRLPGLNPVERAKLTGLRRMRAHQGLDPAAPEWDTNPWWAARSLGASIVMQGSIDPQGDHFHLHVRAIDPQSVVLATAGQDLDWTEERRGWDKLPVADFPVLAPKAQPRVPARGNPAWPKCAYCPSPPYTEEARRAKFSGTVLLKVTVGEDGSVRDVVVQRGQPYGLTEQAVAAVQNWRFVPAKDPEGKSVSMEIAIEVNFRVADRP